MLFFVVFFGYDGTLNQISCKKVKFVDDSDAVLDEYKTNDLDDEGRSIVVNKPYEGVAVLSDSKSLYILYVLHTISSFIGLM